MKEGRGRRRKTRSRVEERCIENYGSEGRERGRVGCRLTGAEKKRMERQM